MPHSLSHLLKNNRSWAEQMERIKPGFFARLSRQSEPKYLWIGCADSRIPANELLGLLPGELFVHRNIANIVVHTDLNCLSVMQFAVQQLQVEHIIVCGHYDCSGVDAAYHDHRAGLSDNWLRHIQDVQRKHSAWFAQLPSDAERIDRLCELNVIEQVVNVCRTTVVEQAWTKGRYLAVHGWIYGLTDGLLRDLGMTVTVLSELESARDAAVAALVTARPSP